MRTSDGGRLKIGMRAWVRYGSPYGPANAQVIIHCVVLKIKDTRVRLVRVNGHRGFWRRPNQIYSIPAAARDLERYPDLH